MEGNVIESEWGGNVKFVGDEGAYFSKVTLHDGEGNEIENPRCKICNELKQIVIGVKSFAWFCSEHGFGNDGMD